MSKKTTIQPQDKYVLRMPDGLRDRIKAAASRSGRSMNTEIIRVLEKEFPEPISLSERLQDLSVLFNAMDKARGHAAAMSVLEEELMRVLTQVALGRDPEISSEAAREVSDAIATWYVLRAEKKQERQQAVDEKYRSHPSGEDDVSS